MNYSYYYRKELKIDSRWEQWDLFISAFNLSERVQSVFDHVQAAAKYWLIYPEYGFDADEFPNQYGIEVSGDDETSQFQSLLKQLDLNDYIDSRVCIDTTGFMRPQLLFLLYYFKYRGFKSVDFIYSEPNTYIRKEKTQFAYGSVYETRQIQGFQGVGATNDKRDLLIILAGYDSNLIGKVAQFKENSDIVELFGFPSLRPDMYQENILRTVAAYDSFTGNTIKDPIYAPAWDPFETASAINNYIKVNRCLREYRHIYISPLSTKAQTLGAGLVCLNEFEEKTVSLVFPFTRSYGKETSSGIAKIWQYTLEF